MKSEKVLLTGRGKDQSKAVMKELWDLNTSVSGPFRLEKEIDPGKKGWVKYMRERTWFEFFYEGLIATSQEKREREKEVVAALEHAFRPIICAARSAAYHKARKYENQSCDEELIDVPSGYARNMDDADNQLPLPANRVARKELGKKVLPSEYIKALEDLLGLYCNKALGVVKPINEAGRGFRPFQFPAVTGSSDGVPHFYITKRPALEFSANNVIVGSVNALAVKKAEASATLRRALSAFKEAWYGAKSRCSLPGPAQGSHGDNGNGLARAKIQFPHATLTVANGLEHIEKLISIPDDVGRDHSTRFQDFGSERWKKFYMAGCEEMTGSVVRELYPNYYIPDPKNKNKRIPYYSNGNVDGAVAAALELSSVFRKDDRDPVFFMFAGLNEDAYRRIQEARDRRQKETNRGSSDAPRRTDSMLPNDVPTPVRKILEIMRSDKVVNDPFKTGNNSSLLIDDDE